VSFPLPGGRPFVVVAYPKYASLLRVSGAPANGILQDATCICLPARSRFGEGRDIFEQPGKSDFFSKPLLEEGSLPRAFVEGLVQEVPEGVLIESWGL